MATRSLSALPTPQPAKDQLRKLLFTRHNQGSGFCREMQQGLTVEGFAETVLEKLIEGAQPSTPI